MDKIKYYCRLVEIKNFINMVNKDMDEYGLDCNKVIMVDYLERIKEKILIELKE